MAINLNLGRSYLTTTAQPSASLRGPGFAQDEHEFLNKSSGVAVLFRVYQLAWFPVELSKIDFNDE